LLQVLVECIWSSFGPNPVRMPLEFWQIIQLSPETRIDDWYIFKGYNIIRIYGNEFEPYLLPIYITMCLFSLEYRRKILAADHLHFISKSKKTSFNLPTQFFSFIIKNRSTIDVVNKIVYSLGFKRGEM
jgi:hypothetical protein